MPAPLANRNALVLGVERPAGRQAAVALSEAGADVAAVTLSEDSAAEFAANSAANEFWAMGRKGVALASDGGETTVKEAIADATAELGPISILVCHARAPLSPAALSGLRSDPAIVVLVGSEAEETEAEALLTWTYQLARDGLRANALVPAAGPARAAPPAIKQHHPPEPLDMRRAVVYLCSDESAALEGVMVIASA